MYGPIARLIPDIPQDVALDHQTTQEALAEEGKIRAME